MMSEVERIIKKLDSEGFSPEIEKENYKDTEWVTIRWTDTSGDSCFIDQVDVAVNYNSIAWFQSSERDNHLLRVINPENEFSWTPETYNPIFGCTCLLLEWYEGYLIFIYQEKHDIYICSIKDKAVKYFSFHGEEIQRKRNLIAYKNYSDNDEQKVKLIKIPQLEQLTIDFKEAEKMDLIPAGLNRPDGFLKNN